MSEKKYTYEEFLEIIAALRSENGCPWDKVQTHESLKPCMMEEAAELLASIRIFDKTGNPENMIEELGDVLLQVVMHAQIASEENLFTMEDVVNEVARKMVRRHPHVFGTGNADTPDEVLVNWEEIKKEEKKDKDWVESPLREIPRELPALTRAVKVLKKIDKHYDKGNTYEQDVEAVCRLAESLRDCEPEKENEKLQAVLSELLLHVSDVARIAKIPQEQILTDKIDDLIDKYE